MNDLTEMATLSAGTVPAGVDAAVARATDALLAAQNADGHWVYELEADSTIPAEYVLLVHYLGETPNVELEQKIGKYLRRIQQADGGWPLFTDGAPNMVSFSRVNRLLRLENHCRLSETSIFSLSSLSRKMKRVTQR